LSLVSPGRWGKREQADGSSCGGIIRTGDKGLLSARTRAPLSEYCTIGSLNTTGNSFFIGAGGKGDDHPAGKRLFLDEK